MTKVKALLEIMANFDGRPLPGEAPMTGQGHQMHAHISEPGKMHVWMDKKFVAEQDPHFEIQAGAKDLAELKHQLLSAHEVKYYPTTQKLFIDGRDESKYFQKQ